ncbi:MAG: folate-binding protein [Pseudomonadota bacterium]
MLHGLIADRRLIRLSGAEARPFLQDLVTNDVEAARDDAAVYAALLTPQGKFVADFLVLADGAQDLIVDVAAGHAPALAQALVRYRLRRPVGIEEAGWGVACLWSDDAGAPRPAAPDGLRLAPDPRTPDLGLRLYAPEGRDAARDALAALGAAPAPTEAWTARRIAARAPETGVELTADAYILEAGFERLNGVDFTKGCFVGQEIVARMKHKTTLRRDLLRLTVQGEAPPPGTPVQTEDGRAAGALGASAGGTALALLRLDRADGPLTAGAARLTRLD